MQRPLWQCPLCQREFANRNQTHTCGLHSIEEHFAGKDAIVRELFDAFVEALRTFGDFRILPEKTRIAFQVRMSFAQVTTRRSLLDGHLVLARRVEHPIFRNVETFSPRNHVHHFRLASVADLSPAFLGFPRRGLRGRRSETPRRQQFVRVNPLNCVGCKPDHCGSLAITRRSTSLID